MILSLRRLRAILDALTAIGHFKVACRPWHPSELTQVARAACGGLALAHAMLVKAAALKMGQRLRFA